MTTNVLSAAQFGNAAGVVDEQHRPNPLAALVTRTIKGALPEPEMPGMPGGGSGAGAAAEGAGAAEGAAGVAELAPLLLL